MCRLIETKPPSWKSVYSHHAEEEQGPNVGERELVDSI